MKRQHHNLLAWQRSIQLVKAIYRLTSTFPREELYGLTGQLRRADVSVACNIAEGAARNSDKEFVQFLGIGRGSLSEVETLLIIARKLGYVADQHDVLPDLEELFALLGGLMNSIKERSSE